MKIAIKAVKTIKETDKAVMMSFNHFFDSKTTKHFHPKKTIWIPKSVFSYMTDSFAAEILIDSWFYKKNMQNLTDGWGE